MPEDTASREEGRRRQRVLALNKAAARWYYQNLSRPEGAAAAEYLKEDGEEDVYVVTCFSDRDKLLECPSVKREGGN